MADPDKLVRWGKNCFVLSLVLFLMSFWELEASVRFNNFVTEISASTMKNATPEQLNKKHFDRLFNEELTYSEWVEKMNRTFWFLRPPFMYIFVFLDEVIIFLLGLFFFKRAKQIRRNQFLERNRRQRL